MINLLDGVLLTTTFALAAANGANDVSKGIATLVGSGVAALRRAIFWGTAWTALGAALASVVAQAMVSTFGRGMIASHVHPTRPAALATLVGATAWVFLATRAGWPISTTHAIVGATVGVAAAAYGIAGVKWAAVGSKIALPLLIAPFSAFVLVALLLKVFRANEKNSTPTASKALNQMHWLTSGATCMARGLNDAPKLVAIALAASALQPNTALSRGVFFAAVTAGMVFGSLLGGSRVTRVLAQNVTEMNHREGFASNLVTSVLVSVGAVYGWPMSTTQVASGGIVGVGWLRGALQYRTLREIGLAWLVTVPAAAGLALVAYAVLK